jgi:nitrogen fixation/metabolism regulation signal transduction histidine kinase
VKKRRLDLTRRVTLIGVAQVLVAALLAAVAAALVENPYIVAAAALIGGLAFGAAMARWALSDAARTLRAMADGVRSFRDSDFSVRLAVVRDDELGDLARLYNEMGETLRRERQGIYQRELLLDTILQGTPVAIVLCGSTDRVVYANRASRDLLGKHEALEGRALAEILTGCPPEMQDAMSLSGDVVFTLAAADGGTETYRSIYRSFHLNTQRHTLRLVERLTPELRRREVEVWKKAIRIMNHELNNSLAPIGSLLHSARYVLTRPEHADRLPGILDTVDERVKHLALFLEEYARFARLPRPRKELVAWPEFLDGVRRLMPFRLEGVPPSASSVFDAAQIQQVLINLLKNAHEAGSSTDDTTVSVRVGADGSATLEIADRGPGMTREVMEQALLPFFSSRPGGTGLGLALCSEILEAHGGRLRLSNRLDGGLLVTCFLPAVEREEGASQSALSIDTGNAGS